MEKITIIIGRELRQLEGTFDKQEHDAALGKDIYGQILNYPKECLVTLLGPCEDGRLETMIDGRRYKITELLSDGRFKAVADFKP